MKRKKNCITYVDEMFRMSFCVQFELINSGITHHCSCGNCDKKIYDDTWNPLRMFGVTHKKNSFLIIKKNTRNDERIEEEKNRFNELNRVPRIFLAKHFKDKTDAKIKVNRFISKCNRRSVWVHNWIVNETVFVLFVEQLNQFHALQWCTMWLGLFQFKMN